MYRVEKVLNHNAVIGILEHSSQEYLIMGRGIGFGKHVSENIEITENETIYSLKEPTDKGDKKQMATSINPVYLEVASEILDKAEEAFQHIDRNVMLPMADHIEFAVTRSKNQEQISNPLTDDIRILFHAEYKVAEEGRKILKERLHVDLTDDEIGYIALHIHSAIMEEKVSQAMQMAEAVRECVNIVEHETGKKIDVLSLAYNRLINHVRYMVARTLKGEKLSLDLNEYMETTVPPSFEMAKNICKKLEKSLKQKINDAEIGYLAMHIERVVQEELE